MLAHSLKCTHQHARKQCILKWVCVCVYLGECLAGAFVLCVPFSLSLADTHLQNHTPIAKNKRKLSLSLPLYPFHLPSKLLQKNKCVVCVRGFFCSP